MRGLTAILILCAAVSFGQYAPVTIGTNTSLYSATTGGPSAIASATIGALTASDLIISATNRWDDLRVSPNGANPVGIADAAVLVVESGSTADQLALRFADGSVRVAATAYQLPHSWVSNTVVWPHIHFSPTTTGTGAVVFVSHVAWANIGETFPSSTITTNTYHITTNSQWSHMLWAIPAAGVNGTNKWFSSVINWRFQRVGTHADDTYGGDIDLYSADLHYRWRGAPVVYAP